jgi:hypothetical protein
MMIALCFVPSSEFDVHFFGEQHLAFLRSGDVWITSVPNIVPIQFTTSGDILIFAWLPDGTGIVTFDGYAICYMNYPADGTTGRCTNLDLLERYVQGTAVVISPDQQSVVISNPEDYWGSWSWVSYILKEEQAIGWLIVGADGEVTPVIYPEEMGVDFGVHWDELPPGRENHSEVAISGIEPPVFLDGALVGSFTCRYWCGSGGCSYVLHEFDFAKGQFHPYDLDHYNLFPWGCAGEDLAFSSSESILTSFGTWRSGVNDYGMCYSVLDLAAREVHRLMFDQEILFEQSLTSDGRRAVVSRGSRYHSIDDWSVDCSLSTEFDLPNMQILDLRVETLGQRIDLLPGRYPEWSADDSHIAFQACLTKEDSEGWQVSRHISPSIYVGKLDRNRFEVVFVSEGKQPHWRP